MKFIHLSDLHLGKSIYGISMIDNGDQPDWVEKFLKTAEETKPDAVVIAGDVYDRSAPSGKAVVLFDHMLTVLADLEIPVLMVAGNHDSGERLSFAGDLLIKSQIYIAGTLKKELTSVTIQAKDGSDEVTFWLLPYVFPALVSQVLEDETIRDYDGAVRKLLEAQDIDFTKKNVLIAHQNVTAGGKEGLRGGSETMVGGVGQIDYTAFDGFTYVALGHIHAAYPVGRKEVRYAGSPLYYHFDETRQAEKGPLLVEIGENGEVTTTLLKIPAKHPMRVLRGPYQKLKEKLEQNLVCGEYLRIEIEDQRITPDIAGYLRSLCEKRNSVLMELVSVYQEFGSAARGLTQKEVEGKSMEELFSLFFTERSGGEEPDEQEKEIIQEAGEIVRNYRGSQEKEPGEKAVEKLLEFIMKQEG